MTPTPEILPIVDCDVHAVVPSINALRPYVSAYWQEQIDQTGFAGPVDRWLPPTSAIACRPEFRPQDGSVAASRFELILKDVFSAVSAVQPDLAVLHCDLAVESLHNPDAAAALAQAANQWLAERWLAADARLRAAIVVPSQFPALAAEEIDRRAGERGFVAVLLPVRSETPYGSRNFRPVFAAAARHRLPVVMHYGGAPGNPSTPVGWPSFHLEEYAGMTGVFQTQLISLISGGVFGEFPDLHVVLAESGVSWLPAMLWRLDKNWKGLRREIPWVKQAPSEYVRQHVHLTVAPADLPDRAEEREAVLAQLGGDELLLYASDYPHAHGEPAAAWSRKVLSENPQAIYRLS